MGVWLLKQPPGFLLQSFCEKQKGFPLQSLTQKNKPLIANAWF